MFRKAQRKQVKLKIGFSASSGAGKTYSALLMAYGMCGDWNKVAVIDTENNSAELYSHLGGYSVCPIKPPFTPKKYIAAISEAVEAGFKVLIIDSLTHAWNGVGGLLEMKDNATKASKSGNSYTAWRDVSPEHNRLVDAILQSDIDVIVTLRAKSEYVMEQENGKTTIKKVGLAPIFREGLEFELTVFFDLSQEHIATASKDRTELFDGQNFKPSAETGKALAAWRNGGAGATEKQPAKKQDNPTGQQPDGEDDAGDDDNIFPPESYKCAVCGKVITQKLFEQSLKKYGTPLCSAECRDRMLSAERLQGGNG